MEFGSVLTMLFLIFERLKFLLVRFRWDWVKAKGSGYVLQIGLDIVSCFFPFLRGVLWILWYPLAPLGLLQ